MQKEIELKCLCDGLLDALREMGLGKVVSRFMRKMVCSL